MNTTVAILLAQDGLTNGAIYALLALVLVTVFSVTRIIFVPQGEFVSYAALTLAWLQAGRVPGTVWLAAGGAILIAGIDFWSFLRRGRNRSDLSSALAYAALPFSLVAGSYLSFGAPYWVSIVVTLAVIGALGPVVYRLGFHRLANSSILLLLIVAIAIHFLLTGLGLLFFGAEGVRNPALFTARFQWGGYLISGQALFVWAMTLILMAMAFVFFGFSLTGKALRATAFNRVGARLVGISPRRSGTIAFLCASLIGAVTGVLISSFTTLYYDTGFVIGLKGFVAAIVGALVSYPVAVIGALAIGMIETFAAFWASSYKDVIIFAAIIPILIWQNLFAARHADDEEADE
jgi:branched-chain amino acid transport system permease protein